MAREELHLQSSKMLPGLGKLICVPGHIPKLPAQIIPTNPTPSLRFHCQCAQCALGGKPRWWMGETRLCCHTWEAWEDRSNS